MSIGMETIPSKHHIFNTKDNRYIIVGESSAFEPCMLEYFILAVQVSKRNI